MRTYILSNFKRAFGINQRVLNLLVKQHIVELQQSGFLAHSLAHDKIVVVRKPDLLQYYVKNPSLFPLKTRLVKKANRELSYDVEQKLETKAFDYLYYQELMMNALPSEMAINTEVLDHLLYFITDCIPDVEEDRKFEKVDQYARIFEEWENGTFNMTKPILSPNELVEQENWEEAKKLSKLLI